MSTRLVRRLSAALSTVLVLALLGFVAFAQDDGDAPNVNASWANVLWDSFEAAPYTDWSFEPGVPEGYYVGVEPHGMILRTFVNDIAMADFGSGADAFSSGAVIIKENHMPTGVDLSSLDQQDPVADFGGDLAAWTYMVKVPGFAPDTGDWFYGRIAGDGSLLAAGSPEGCVACHSQVAEDNDWVFNGSLAGN